MSEMAVWGKIPSVSDANKGLGAYFQIQTTTRNKFTTYSELDMIYPYPLEFPCLRANVRLVQSPSFKRNKPLKEAQTKSMV